MPKVTMIHHVNVQTSNRQRTQEWYEKVLGAEFLDRGSARNERQLQLRIGSGQLAGSFMCSGMRGSVWSMRASGHGLYSSGTSPGG